MDEIKEIIDSVIADLSSKRPQQQQDIQDIWKDVAGSRGTDHSLIYELRDHRLVIHVDSSAWLFQFQTQKKKLLGEIQSKIPEVKAIYFKIGTVK